MTVVVHSFSLSTPPTSPTTTAAATSIITTTAAAPAAAIKVQECQDCVGLNSRDCDIYLLRMSRE